MHACIRNYLLAVFTTLVTGLTIGTSNYVNGTTHQGIRHHSSRTGAPSWQLAGQDDNNQLPKCPLYYIATNGALELVVAVTSEI